MPEIPPVTGGDTIATSWGNPISERVISRYANATARDVAVPVPVAGDPAYLVDVDELQVYDGSGWRVYPHIDSAGTFIIPRPNRIGGALLAHVGQNDSQVLTAQINTPENLIVLSVSGIGPTPDPLGSRAVWLTATCYLNFSVGGVTPEFTFELFDIGAAAVIGRTKETATGAGKRSITVQGWAATEGSGFRFRVERTDVTGTQIVEQSKLTQIWIDAT